MSLNRKRSRPITIDGQPYRWAVSDDYESLTLTVQHAGGSGQKISVTVASDLGRFWVEFPDPRIKKFNLRPIKPSDVSAAIRQALAQGWQPTQAGPTLRFHLDAKQTLITQSSS